MNFKNKNQQQIFIYKIFFASSQANIKLNLNFKSKIRLFIHKIELYKVNLVNKTFMLNFLFLLKRNKIWAIVENLFLLIGIIISYFCIILQFFFLFSYQSLKNFFY